MGDTLVTLAGTPEGARLATILALTSAFAHALFGALQKGRWDPWITRAAIDLHIALFAAPVALFVVPWPTGLVWGWIAGAMAVHLAYKIAVARAYDRAAYTVVYPVIRGTGPMVTMAVAATVFAEVYSPLQWAGVALLSGAILSLSVLNLRTSHVLDRQGLARGLAWAVGAGVLVAAYTAWDAAGIRATPDPFTFLAWFFLLGALDFPLIAAVRLRHTGLPDGWRLLALKGAAGALVAFVSFGGVMLATRLDKVGQAAVLRETSTVFAALLGWALLGEQVGRARASLMALIAAGAVIVQAGG
jgi:drug/metabolite transporter (DMT)-like permease